MALDPRLSLALQPVQIAAPDPIQTYSTLANLKRAQTYDQLQQLQIAQALRKQQRQEAFLDALTRQGDAESLAGGMTLAQLGQQPQPTMADAVPRAEPGAYTRPAQGYEPPYETMYTRAPASVQPRTPAPAPPAHPREQAMSQPPRRAQMTWQQALQLGGQEGLDMLNAIRTYERADEQQQLKMQVQGFDYLEKGLGAITNQATLDGIRQQLQRQNPTLAQALPQTYSPEAIEGLRQQMLGSKERIELQLRGQDYRLRQATEARRAGESDRDYQLRLQTEQRQAGAQQTELGLKGQAQEDQLRTQFTGLTKDYRTVADAHGRIQTAAQTDSPAADIALVYGYMKLLDPGSVVREGEFATAQNAGAIPERVIAAYNKLLTDKGRLSPDVKADFVARAEDLYGRATRDYEKVRDQYRELATRQNLNPDNVTLNFRSTAADRTTYNDAVLDAGVKQLQDAGRANVTREELEKYWQSLGRRRAK